MLKRILQCLVLAIQLLGVPVAMCLLFGDDNILKGLSAFPPRTEDWGGVAYWQQRCPFSWFAFVSLAVLITAVLAPFVRRSLIAAFAGGSVERRRHPFPWWGWVGLVMFVGWLPVVWAHPVWAAKLQVHSFAVMGFGHALLMDALAYRRIGTSVFGRAWVAWLVLLPVSALYWWFFEFLNRFSRNWYFINLENFTTWEYVTCFSIGCATILPSVVTTARWLGTFRCFSDDACAGMWKVDVGSWLSRFLMILVSVSGLVGVVVWPEFAYPFLWLSPICGFLLVMPLTGEKTGLEILATGNWSVVWRWAVAMLICGLVWETWGFWIVVRWVYSVPYLHRFCYAEMPLIGFAGYLPFGVEAFLVCRWVGRGLVEREEEGDV